jgi:hypothetical protein
MRDTLREPTASLRSENPPNETETLSRLNIPGISPALLTASSTARQEDGRSRLLIREPIISKIGDAADIAYASHRETGGSTVSVFDGNLAGRKLLALSVFPDRTVELYDPPTWRQLFVFALQNLDLVLRLDCSIGTWYDRDRHRHVLDVVVCISNLEAALELGKCFEQQFVYDLERRQKIAVPYQSPVSIPNFVRGRQ